MIVQKCHEWRIKMWTSTIDYSTPLHTNQFGKHSNQFGKHSNPADYISFLKKIYRDQKASVQTDEKSDMFEIKNQTG